MIAAFSGASAFGDVFYRALADTEQPGGLALRHCLWRGLVVRFTSGLRDCGRKLTCSMLFGEIFDNAESGY